MNAPTLHVQSQYRVVPVLALELVESGIFTTVLGLNIQTSGITLQYELELQEQKLHYTVWSQHCLPPILPFAFDITISISLCKPYLEASLSLISHTALPPSSFSLSNRGYR